ncbi:hypothetical protein BD410DRAFT_819875 [Rickenella mellea]|uniref:Macrofage activating glyco protein n=1 Tax=Rickenella mellea TaxID=50990 RepID=A0A4Y7QDT1_9AGAM|nr:hypothetical protein BD410DRAFT_819875 [Rickenella mellea]
MATHALLSILAITSSTLVAAQSPTTQALEPLASKHFTYPNIPYQVTGDQGGIRGPQFGFNLCNSTTENQQSNCQTAFVNSIADFCMWSSDQPNDTVGESEAREVAWCTTPGHGTRVIPPGTITGAQWLYAKDYVQVVGFLDQSKVNLNPTDMGGELDPHGADEQGNPLGGIVFTNAFGVNSQQFQSQVSSNNLAGSQTFTQVIEWIDFIGSGMFCLKMCNPDNPNAPQLCQHIYDEIGCTYNALANYGAINGTFQVCDSDDMTPPGVFTQNGQVTTWFQPQAGPVVPPYTPVIPSSSNCVTYASTQLWAAAATDTNIPKPTTSSSSSAAAATGAGSGTTARTTSGSTSSPTASSGSIPSVGGNGGTLPFIAVGLLTTLCTMMSMAFLA